MVAGSDGLGGAYQGRSGEETSKGDEGFFAQTTRDFLPTTFFVEFAIMAC